MGAGCAIDPGSSDPGVEGRGREGAGPRPRGADAAAGHRRADGVSGTALLGPLAACTEGGGRRHGTLGILPDRIERLTGPLQKDTDPMVRAECARALGKLGSLAAVGTLMYAVATDPSPEVRSLAVEALSRLRAAETEPILTTSALQDPSSTVRAQAVEALAEISPVSSRGLFETLWRETADPDVRLEAYRALLRSADASRWVEEGLENTDVSIRFLALRSWFSRIAARPQGIRLPRTSAEIVRLGNFLKDTARGIREFSRQSLGALGYKTRPDGFAYSIDDR